MILLLTLFGSVGASDIDVPVNAEIDMIQNDQLYETSMFSFYCTNPLTVSIMDQRFKSVTILVNCMLYWIHI